MLRLVPPDEWCPRGIEALEGAADSVVRSDETTLVSAGPGAGKTELLAQRASFLLETGRCPSGKRILAISFKRDAAKNLKDRVALRSGAQLSERFDSFTFDALAKNLVDQFYRVLPSDVRPSPDYDVLLQPLSVQELDEILGELDPPSGATEDLRQFAQRTFFEHDVPKVPLFTKPSDLRQWAAREMWRVLLRERPTSQLSFRMITRLAGEVLKRSDTVRRALRVSYSHVFLDEFQDTTDLQYWFTKLLFRQKGSVLTAVGDSQQRIMGWANALDGVFDKFVGDFEAKVVRLSNNYRAGPNVKPVVMRVSENLDAVSGAAWKRTELAETPDASGCTLNLFNTDVEEAAWVAGEVARLVAGGVSPRSVAVLVRQKAVDYGREIIAQLSKLGVSSRVEDHHQDLLAEPIVEAALLGLVALGAAKPGSDWGSYRTLVGEAKGLPLDEPEAWARLERELGECRSSFRSFAARVPTEPSLVRRGLREWVEPHLLPVRAKYSRYRQGDFYESVMSTLSTSFATLSPSADWARAAATVLGLETVPILTIHKSKGLEYDAVFFVGLEDGAFWNFDNNPGEEANAFFVALSRAKHRVEFTFAKTRQRTKYPRQSVNRVKPLYDLAQNAGARIVQR